MGQDYKLPELSGLSPGQKDELIVELYQMVVELRTEVAALRRENEELKARLNRPPKGPHNSSVPPSRGNKASAPVKPNPNQRRRREAHGLGGRPLAETFDELQEVYLDACPHCRAEIPEEAQHPQHSFDHIDIPPIRATTTRVKLYGCACPGCGRALKAAPPPGMNPASPYGPNLTLLFFSLRYEHAVALHRLRRFGREFLGVTLSQGALVNMIKRAGDGLMEIHEALGDRVRGAAVINSDETGIRVQRRNWWEWVFIGGGAVVHLARDSRGFKVIDDFLRGHRPEAWGSDRLRAQRKAPANVRQACLAHLLRDCNLAIETGDQCFAPRLKALLLEIIDLYWARDGLGPQDFNAQKQDLRQKIGTLFDRRRTRPWTDDGVHLQKQLASLRDDLTACLDIPQLEPTNNISERAIRMSKVFQKVTGGFRTPWAADVYTAIRSIINTGQLHGFTPKQALSRALNGHLPLPT